MKLDARGISLRFDGRDLLRDVSLNAIPGRLTGLIGPNGAGKTTLLKVLCGLNVPDQGCVLVDDQDLMCMPASERARIVAYVPQQRELFWPISVREVVALGRLPYRRFGFSGGVDHELAVDDAMLRMDVFHLQERFANQLSGGELARVMAARALAQTPSVLLADEPISGLDPAHQLRMLDCFKSLAEAGMTVVISLHDLALAARYCDHLLLLDQGRAYASGKANDVLRRESMREVFRIEARAVEVDGLSSIVTISAIQRCE